MAERNDTELDPEGTEAFEDDLGGEEGPRTFTVNGRTYSVRLSKQRLDLYEQRHKPIMASFIQNEGAFSTAELTAILAYGLCLEGEAYVNPRRGMEMAERLVTTNGYLAVYEAVMDALQRDCGFFIPGRLGRSLRLLTEYEYFRTDRRPGLDEDAARMWRHDLDFAYFAAHLGWDLEQYGSCTPVQLLFIRKEIEGKTVRESNLLKDAVQVAVSNCLSKRRAKLWAKNQREYDGSQVSISEIEAMQARLRKDTPWTPWQRGGEQRG